MRSRLALLISIAVLAGFGLHAGGAGAVTFGADLNAAADNTAATCNSGYFYSIQSSCTMFSGLPGPTFYAPASGTVTAVRVKTGNSVGPMQVIVMSSLYQNHFGDPGHPYFACCFVQEYGPTFTPGANSITTVPTSLTMVEQPTPAADDFTTNARGDFLALSVLVPDVPMPANVDGVSGYSPIAPAPNTTTYPAPSANPILTGSGYPPFMHVLMSANLDTSGGGINPVPQGNPLNIASGGQLLGTTASIPLVCVLTTACDGTLRLTNQAIGAATAAKKKKKAKTYGSKKFSIPAGKKKNVKVKLNAAGRKKLGKRKTLTVTATATVGSQTVSSRVKLKRKNKR